MRARTQGGGSATVVPARVISPLEGIREAYPDAHVEHAVGARVQSGVAELPLEQLVNPVTGGAGVRVRFLDPDGAELYAEDRRSARLVWLGTAAPVDRCAVLELTTRWTPAESGRVRFGFEAAGAATIEIDGRTVLDRRTADAGDDPGTALFTPPTATTPLDVEAGRTLDVRIAFRRAGAGGLDVAALAFGLDAGDDGDDRLLAEAAELAARSDVVILVVGTSSTVESEGFDRTDLALPGRQDELAERVLSANPRTVAVVNSGSPVLLGWRDRAAAILLTWFGGQEYGHALADVLTGEREPGGRLPTTWPGARADVPVLDVTPRGGVLRYAEGIHIGYRAWLRAGSTPAWPFGFGLGYTSWRIDAVMAGSRVSAETGVEMRVSVTNTGQRAGKQVVQVYAARPDSAIERPVRWLVGFAVVHAAAGAAATAAITIPARAFAHWDDGWRHEPGGFALTVGTSVADTAYRVEVTV